MPSVDILLSFFAAAFLFAYMPGPSMLYATARTIAGGKAAGWQAAIGIHMGGYLHVIAAAFGLAVMFDVFPVLYLGLKIVGAGYLIWLGLSLFLSKASPHLDDMETPQKTTKRAFWDSAVVEMLNPKTALFYLAFLPQFTDMNAVLPIWAQLLILGSIVNLLFSSADVLCVILASKIMHWFQDAKSQAKWAQKVGGLALIGLGIHLMTSHE